MSLIKSLQPQLPKLPQQVQASLGMQLQQLHEKLEDRQLTLPEHPLLMQSMLSVWCCSKFVGDHCIQQPELLIDLTESGDLFSAYQHPVYLGRLQQQKAADEQQLMRGLRAFRCREMMRIAWRDLAGWADVAETLQDLSLLAEACIQYALDFLYAQACSRRGTPRLPDGRAQKPIVLGMGKLGAGELNFSSDIDLIFAYVQDGVLDDRKQTTYGEFFSRLCRSLVKVLDEVTVDGFVFRTDIRLRPFGESGPIIMNFDGMEAYYLTQAREWERFAMIKARQVAGDRQSGDELMRLLKPFIYRRYLDYGAFEELRILKVKINEELQRKDRMDNVKLGPGGIREIEFIGQAFQLIRGGQEPALQYRGILKIIAVLGELGLLDKDTSRQLSEAYLFLRQVENHIQQYQDKQTHDLPTDETERLILGYSMGFADWPSFKQQLDSVRDFVHSLFDEVFSVNQEQVMNADSQSVWIGEAAEPILIGHLSKLGYQDCDAILQALSQFKQSFAIKRLTSKGAAVMDRLMPQLLDKLLVVDNPQVTLQRILGLFEAVAGRNVYLSLLSENPEALKQVIKLSSASSWMCDYLSRYPVLFDELLDTRTLYEPLEPEALAAELAEMLRKTDRQDEEQLMYALRNFKQLQMLRVAATDIMGFLPLMLVSDYLSYIAEVILQESLRCSWQFLTEKHGKPPGVDINNNGFAILGFGKLGGRELAYGSDLDMVFLYDYPNLQAMTDGKKSISVTQFYIRLGQKVRHLLQTRLLCGMLYEVDLRLRPSGDSGLLVSNINMYEDYMRNNAWVWEHQALIRARFVCGDVRIADKFNVIRGNILSMSRDKATLKKDVYDMREKMRESLAPKDQAVFSLKHSKGGIVDIEFIVQFKVLAESSTAKELLRYTDSIRLLACLQKLGFIDEHSAGQLTDAYCRYRELGHKQTLQGKTAMIDAEICADTAAQVRQIWQNCMQ